MAYIKGPKEATVLFKFGGGVHSRAAATDIHPKECVSGQNFELDLQDSHFRPRKPFDLIGTAPNGGEIRGFASLKKTDGTTTLLIQAGDTVYSWTSATEFTSVGSVDSTAQLRGRISHNWLLDDEVIITDLNLKEPVKKWTGSALSDIVFTDEDDVAWVGEFRAKYCVIEGERVIFGNVYDDSTLLPHVVVGSKLTDYTQLTVANRPSSAIGEDDPYYIPTPDLRPINGMVSAFNTVAISTKQGRIFRLTGASAQDFQITGLHPDSGVDGDEAMTYVGNDVLYGRTGRLEALSSTDKYGDVEEDDLTVGISDLIKTYGDWIIVYNSRFQKVYCHPVGKSQVWVLYKPLVKTDVSPWIKLTTDHSVDFNPTAMMNAYDPDDGLEYVFFGDSAGNVFRMEGSGSLGDGGLYPVKSIRKSVMLEMPEGTEAMNLTGWVKYIRKDPVTISLRFIFQGDQIHESVIQITLSGPTNRTYFGGGNYFGDGSYFGSDTEKFAREKIGIPGKSTEFQIEAEIISNGDYSIAEIGIQLEAVT